MAVMAVSLSSLLQHVGISEQQLDTLVSNKHLLQISTFLTSRERLAWFLGLDEVDMEVIEADGRGEEDKRLKTLRKWKDKYAFRATYRMLIDALLNLKMASHAEKVCRLLQPEATSSDQQLPVPYTIPQQTGVQEPVGAVGGGEEEVPLSDLAYLSSLPVAAEWKRLGLQLGVPSYQLDTIQANYAGQPYLCEHSLSSMFDWWLKNSDSPTPRRLAIALSTIGKRDVAESVARKYDFPYFKLQQTGLQGPVGAVGGGEKEVLSPEDRPLQSPGTSTTTASPVLNHSTVTEYLLDLDKSQVYNLGISLGLSLGRVKSKFDSAHDTTVFLDEIINAWLRGVDQVDEKGGPSWETLVAALKSRRLQQAGIARSIEQGLQKGGGRGGQIPQTGNASTQFRMQYPGAGGGGWRGQPLPYPQQFGDGGGGQVPQTGNALSQFRMQYPGAGGGGWRGHPMSYPQQFATARNSQPLVATPSFQQQGASQQLPSLSSKPRLHELHQFQRKEGGAILLIRCVAYQWRQIALALHLDGSTIAAVAEENPRNTESACIQIFTLWLEGRGSQPVTWSTLIEALNSIELTEISQELQAQFV